MAISGLLASPENRITPSASASGATPSMAPLHDVPSITLMPSTSVSFLYAAIAPWALHCESSTTSSNRRPSTPPAAFISSAAICLDWFATVP